MAGYRSDLEAAQARIASLAAEMARVEAEHAKLERTLRAKPRRPLPWGALAVVTLAGATLAFVLVLSRPPAGERSRLADVPGPTAPVATESSAPIASVPAPSLEPPPMLARPEPPVELDPQRAFEEEMARTTPAVPAFFGQYWEARVTRTREGGPPIGTECSITLDLGRVYGGGVARVRCGTDDPLHITIVAPPPREDDGCWFSGSELYCAPRAGLADRLCWINTAALSATCHRDIDLFIHTRMRDPRESPPPALL